MFQTILVLDSEKSTEERDNYSLEVSVWEGINQLSVAASHHTNSLSPIIPLPDHQLVLHPVLPV